MITQPNAPWIVVIHTNKYSGNFEREMSGYVAGVWDTKSHGGEQAKVFLKECPDVNLIDRAAFRQIDDSSHLSPVTIWPTPGRRNDGYGSHFDEGDPSLKGKGFPAYESVAILFDEEPTAAEIDLIWARAKAFPAFMAAAARFWRTPDLEVLGMAVIHRQTQVIVSDVIEWSVP